MGQAALRGMTVLLVACPCTLGIAIPLVKVASVGLALGFGALVRDPAALERMHGVDTVIFDKTGTLTEGLSRCRRYYTRKATTTRSFHGWRPLRSIPTISWAGRSSMRRAAEASR